MYLHKIFQHKNLRILLFILTFSTTILIFTEAVNITDYNKIEFMLISIWYSTLTLLSGLDVKNEY